MDFNREIEKIINRDNVIYYNDFKNEMDYLIDVMFDDMIESQEIYLNENDPEDGVYIKAEHVREWLDEHPLACKIYDDLVENGYGYNDLSANSLIDMREYNTAAFSTDIDEVMEAVGDLVDWGLVGEDCGYIGYIVSWI